LFDLLEVRYAQLKIAASFLSRFQIYID
jgi:hypothetical protein